MRRVWLVVSVSLSEDKVLLSPGPRHDINKQRLGWALRLGRFGWEGQFLEEVVFLEQLSRDNFS